MVELYNVLTRCLPEDVGIPSAAIESFVDRIEEKGIELHSFMLLRHGRMAAEGYWAPYAAQLPHMLYSLSKSFTSTAVGLAIDEGLFALDDYVLDYFMDDAPKNPDENLRRMRIRDLLCMATGHEKEPEMFGHKSWEKAFLAEPVKYKPGTYFLYNTPATYMLSSLVTKTSGEGLVDYLYPRLFQPLGIQRPNWDESPSGVAIGGIGLHLKTEDIARFGQLLLQEGIWYGKRIIPKHWVRLATAWQVDNSRDRQGEWARGYGFQFWRCRFHAYRGDGMHGQFCVVMPDQDAVFAATAGTTDMQGVLDALFDIILPAIDRHHLPSDPDAAIKMIRRLEELKLPNPAETTGDQIDPRLLEKTWTIPANGPGEPIHLQLSHKGERIHATLRSNISFAGPSRTRTTKVQFGLNDDVLSTISIGGHSQRAVSRAYIQEGGGLVLTIQMLESPYRIEIELRLKDGNVASRVAVHPQKKFRQVEWVPATEAE